MIYFPIQIRTIRCPLYISSGIGRISLKNVLQSLKIVFILANSAGPDEMLRFAAFNLGFHCLPKYPIRAFKHTKGIAYLF